MLHVRYATQWPLPLSSLPPPACRLSACLQLFALPLVDGVSAVADYALHQCERVYVSVCVCLTVCECFDAMLIYFNSYLMSNVKAHGKREQKKKALKTVAYICAMATARVANHSQCACASVLWYL